MSQRKGCYARKKKALSTSLPEACQSPLRIKGRPHWSRRSKQGPGTASTVPAGMQHLPRSLSQSSGLTLGCWFRTPRTPGSSPPRMEKHCVPNVYPILRGPNQIQVPGPFGSFLCKKNERRHSAPFAARLDCRAFKSPPEHRPSRCSVLCQ